MTTTKTPNHSSGFTLIELMVVIAIVAIIAAVAIPTYQAQIRESRRVDAKTAVLDLAAREEKYFSLNNSYTASPANLGYAAAGSGANFPQPTGSGYYQLYVCPSSTAGSTVTTAFCTAVSGTAAGTGYVVAAAPVTGSSQVKDSLCQYFAVDNTGVQFAYGTAGSGTNTASTCWH